jgi:hypothetical protein
MRTTYTGPVKNRGENARGQANVSREELEDFKRQYGQDKTLRDLLNADRTGKTPASEKSPMARGPQGANVAPGRAEIPSGGGAKAPAERGERMSPLEMGLLTTAGALAGPALGRAAVKAYPTVRAAASKVGEKVSEGVKSAKSAMDAARAARAERAAEAAKTTERAEPKYDLPPPPAKPRMRVEGTKGGVYRSEAPKTESKAGPQFRSRTADRMDEREMGMKKGGKVKTYAKGGSVRGAGCETRTKKTRFV